MKLAFKFRYEHTNGLFVRLMNRLQYECALPLYLSKEGTSYVLEAEGDQSELEALAERVAAQIPLSLFLKEHKVEAVESISGVHEALEDTSGEANIPYCPECYRVIESRSMESLECIVCGTDFCEPSDERYRWADELAGRFIETGSVAFESGDANIRLTHPSQSRQIVVCDPDTVSNAFVITPGELEALAMSEKPLVRLKPKLHTKAEHGMERSFYDVRFADSKRMLLLCDALRRKGIPFVGLEAGCIDPLRAVSVLEEHYVLTPGRDMLPAMFDLPVTHRSYCNAYGFNAVGDSEGVILNNGMQSSLEGGVVWQPKPAESLKGSVEFEPSHGALGSIVMEHGLGGTSVIRIPSEYHGTLFIRQFPSSCGLYADEPFRDGSAEP
jgi:hypothetical protein